MLAYRKEILSVQRDCCQPGEAEDTITKIIMNLDNCIAAEEKTSDLATKIVFGDRIKVPAVEGKTAKSELQEEITEMSFLLRE